PARPRPTRAAAAGAERALPGLGDSVNRPVQGHPHPLEPDHPAAAPRLDAYGLGGRARDQAAAEIDADFVDLPRVRDCDVADPTAVERVVDVHDRLRADRDAPALDAHGRVVVVDQILQADHQLPGAGDRGDDADRIVAHRVAAELPDLRPPLRAVGPLGLAPAGRVGEFPAR